MPALSIRMPRLTARMVPLSTTAPLMVLPRMAMPVLAMTVPVLATLPVKLWTPSALLPAMPIAMPAAPAEILPALMIPPAKVDTPST